jgi:hypothetical protein
MKTKITQNIKAVILGLLVVIGAGYARAAWNAAPSDGPANAATNNVAAPINVGYSSQVKSGTLWIDGLVSAGTAATYSLVTANAPVKTTGGLIIETRTSDPASPETGRIWLLTN